MLIWILALTVTSTAGYSFCPQRVNCIPGCVKIDERGCKECACGELMFHPGGYYGMTGMTSGGGGGGGGGGFGGSFPSFRPGTLAGGSPFGSIQGASHQAAKEKPLKECTGTLLCMTTCRGQYSLGDVGNNGCRSCTCPHQASSHTSSHSTSHTTSHTVQTVSHSTAHVQYIQATHHSSCTGTKLCMATCHTRYSLGPKGRDGCQSCSCMPEPTPAPTPAPTITCMQTYLCMLSCKTGYTLGETGSDGCQTCTCLPPPTAAPATPAPKPLQCEQTLNCMLSCTSGYQLGNTGPDGCPVCSCIQTVAQVVQVFEVKCPAELHCDVCCNVGYKCDSNGCPVCECIAPASVGSTAVMVIQKPMKCPAAFSCHAPCHDGYKCGEDGCPTCECLTIVTVQQVLTHHEECHECEQPHPTPKPDQAAVIAILQKCPHTQECMTSCKNGYHMGSAGVDGCPACSCVEKETCHECTETHHTVEVVQPVQVQTSSTEHCHECETGGHQTQVAVATQGGSGGTAFGGTSSGGHMSGGSGGHSSSGTNGGIFGAMSGAGGMSAGIGAGAGGSQCHPLPPDCHPSCIVYDVAHCRQCHCPMH